MADFTPYPGAQQNWPVAAGAFVDNKYAVPVFWRTKPTIRRNGLSECRNCARSCRRGAVIAFMARRAQEVGGNGLIVLATNRQYVGSVSNSSVTGNVYGQGFTATAFGTTTPMFGGQGDAVVIRFRRAIYSSLPKLLVTSRSPESVRGFCHCDFSVHARIC